MPKDNRNLNKTEDDALLNEILNDDAIIPEDVDPKDPETEEDIPDPHMPDPVKEDPVKEVVEEDQDYKRKFQDSSSEATNLHFKNEQMRNKIDEASNLPEPTLLELQEFAKSRGATYDDLDEFSQNILKDTLLSRRQFTLIREASDAGKKIDDWAKQVDSFSNSSEVLAKFPSLGDLDVPFKKYCMKEARRGMELEDLVASFLFTTQGDAPIKRTEKKKDMLLSGGGGGDSIPKPKEISAEDLRVIRAKDPARYKILVKQGKAGLDLLDRD